MSHCCSRNGHGNSRCWLLPKAGPSVRKTETLTSGSWLVGGHSLPSMHLHGWSNSLDWGRNGDRKLNVEEDSQNSLPFPQTSSTAALFFSFFSNPESRRSHGWPQRNARQSLFRALILKISPWRCLVWYYAFLFQLALSWDYCIYHLLFLYLAHCLIVLIGWLFQLLVFSQTFWHYWKLPWTVAN